MSAIGTPIGVQLDSLVPPIKTTNKAQRRGRALTLGVLMFIASSPAYAQTATSSPEAILQLIVTFVTGTFGQMLAILGIVGCGVAWMFGRASMGLVSGVIGGIVIIFGASYIVTSVIAG